MIIQLKAMKKSTAKYNVQFALKISFRVTGFKLWNVTINSILIALQDGFSEHRVVAQCADQQFVLEVESN